MNSQRSGRRIVVSYFIKNIDSFTEILFALVNSISVYQREKKFCGCSLKHQLKRTSINSKL